MSIEDGRITAIDSGQTDPPAGAQLVDLGDVALLPGLIDVHVHLGFDASATPLAQMMADDAATLTLRMLLAVRRALAAGITTVRDVGDRAYLGLAVRDWFRTGTEVGPEILATGPPITVTGGHCHFLGGEADGERRRRGPSQARAPLSNILGRAPLISSANAPRVRMRPTVRIN